MTTTTRRARGAGRHAPRPTRLMGSGHVTDVGPATTDGARTMLVIQLRTGWKVILAWVLGLAGMLVFTTLSISGLYDTQAKIDSYAAAVGSGDALLAINGHVAGIDTLGGVVANEFGFMASFAIPLMGISLLARTTRKDEEAGRLEALLAGRIGRGAPVLAGALLALGALGLTSMALFLGLVAVSVPVAGSVNYALSLAALGCVFAGVAAIAAQLVGHARGVYGIGLGVLVAAYLLRGVGDVTGTWVTWLSPLGWAEEMRSFGDARWWPVAVPILVAAALVALSVAVSSRRDLDSAVLHLRGSASAASATLRTPVGLAARMHRGAVLGWGAIAVIVSATFGALAQQLIDAMAGNAALEQALGGTGSASADGFLSFSVLLLALLCAAYLVQAVGTLRAEESSGRLEATLSGEHGRIAWLLVQVGVILGGLVVVGALGALALGLSTAWSTGEVSQTGRLVGASVAYLPAVLVLGAIALALFGTVPRLAALAWLPYAGTAVVAFLGPALSWPDLVLRLNPTHHVGYPPLDAVDAGGLAGLSVVALLLGAAALAGFRRRGIPQA